MRFHCLQHVVFETPGLIASLVASQGGVLEVTLPGRLPALDSFDVLIVMGGPMSVHDEGVYPWLKEEKRLIGEAIRAGKRVLGICLGAQLIAEVMGGRVYDNPVKEIGFWPVRWADGEEEVVFHWHGETFDLPPGAELLASSPGCVNQAFRLGENVLGLQYHPEVTAEIIGGMIENEGHELVDGKYIQKEDDIMDARPVRGRTWKLVSTFLIN
ncbi:MAG: gamma-glutamyl-gamma-aminobutyrate hydrolase family protein [Bacteroidetes bacterium]|nr:gamma-glutamyl-gamma-aminobutyrate hydrolase family protein [Bacteroidota bacterium]